MVGRVVISAVLIATLCSVYACDTPEGPNSSSNSSSLNSSGSQTLYFADKTKIPPTSKDDSIKSATATVDAWLKLLDQGQYDVCWDQTGAWFHQITKKDDWAKQIKVIRSTFDPLISRKINSAKYVVSPKSAPEGVYVEISYDSSFGQVKDAEEDVSATYENGKWWPLGYSVTRKPKPKS
jgi:hypothetical protein